MSMDDVRRNWQHAGGVQVGGIWKREEEHEVSSACWFGQSTADPRGLTSVPVA